MLQFLHPWFKFYFPLFWGMVMYDNLFETKEIKFKLTQELQNLLLRDFLKDWSTQSNAWQAERNKHIACSRLGRG